MHGCPCTGKTLADILADMLSKGVVLNIKHWMNNSVCWRSYRAYLMWYWLFVPRYYTVITKEEIGC